MKKLVILASGSGSNAENLIRYFHAGEQARVVKIYSNVEEAGVFARADRLGVPCEAFNRNDFRNGKLLSRILEEEPDLLVLAGFLWLIPADWIAAFPNRIVNIHPALLPKYGGKGMYGMRVHEAVRAAGETETGITIHYVNAAYDEGAIIFQEKTPVLPEDSAAEIAEKVHALEYAFFPKILSEILSEKERR